MKTCVNIEAGEFRALKERSGLPDFLLEVLVADYLDKHKGAWPRLDELPIDWVDSKKALDQFLELGEKSVITQEKLLEKTGKDNILEAIWYLNDVYRNLDVDFYTINNKIRITTDGRPNPFRLKESDAVNMEGLDSAVYIRLALDELGRKMGIIVHQTTTEELNKSGLSAVISNVASASAFIYLGEIYVNTDKTDINESRPHELMHVLLGALKFKNPELYAQITSSVENLENYEDLAKDYINNARPEVSRTRSDVNEELFVREYARMLAGMPSELQNLDSEIIYNLNYEMSRTLDTMLMGDNSVRVIPVKERFGRSFLELGEIVNSHNMENVFQTYLDSALMHRILANKKGELMHKGLLKEECN